MSKAQKLIIAVQREHYQLGSDEEWVCGGCYADFHNARWFAEHLADEILKGLMQECAALDDDELVRLWQKAWSTHSTAPVGPHLPPVELLRSFAELVESERHPKSSVDQQSEWIDLEEFLATMSPQERETSAAVRAEHEARGRALGPEAHSDPQGWMPP